MRGTTATEAITGMVQHIETASGKYRDSGMAAPVAGLEIEFGQGAGGALAHRILKAEEGDFLWDARIEEPWLGSYASIGDEDLELDRIAIFGKIGGRWFAAVMLVDGDGMAHRTTGRRYVRSRRLAQDAMLDAQ
jgi:hypothetical protein